jgi:hypothetical protein
MAMTIKKLNKSLYNASFHMFEAAKYLSNIEEFRPEAARIFAMADELASIIEPEVEKVTEDKMLSILDEILGDTQ